MRGGLSGRVLVSLHHVVPSCCSVRCWWSSAVVVVAVAGCCLVCPVSVARRVPVRCSVDKDHSVPPTWLTEQHAIANNSWYPSHPGTTVYTVYQHLHYAPLIGIGSGQCQLIAVTCIAEHA